jgi:hypothetical protein
MSYREKLAWLMLTSIVLTFGPYFAMVGADYIPEEPMPNLRQLALYGAAAIARMLILGIGYIYLRRAFPAEARMPADERERAIEHRAMSFAYYVLMAGMILVGGVMPFISSGWTIVNTAFFMLALAELVSHGFVVYSYRRQA